jgi:hypothetical protein
MTRHPTYIGRPYRRPTAPTARRDGITRLAYLQCAALVIVYFACLWLAGRI